MPSQMPTTERLDLLLVSMPFGPLRQPSLGLSLLKAAVPELRSRIRYFHLDYARRIGAHRYREVSGGRFPNEAMVGEWLFAAALWDGPQPATGAASTCLDAGAFLDEIGATARPALNDEERRHLLALRAGAERFVADCAAEIVAQRPRIVGFTSVFQQHVASLALARRLARELPQAAILFGGPNCEGVMGLETVRSFPFIDAVVSGEGDALFPALVERLLDGRTIDELPGVYTRANAAAQDPRHPAGTTRLPSLDLLPVPDYAEFFEQWKVLQGDGGDRLPEPPAGGPEPGSGAGLEAGSGAGAEPGPEAGLETPRLLFESSRGCWWGEKKHCTFCGLNGTSMAFRSKSAERALAELSELSGRHPGLSVLVVDNILDMRYFRDFVPGLAQAQLGVELFYEVKANLRKEQLRLLEAAGIREIQPGIESLSDQVLELMGKGVTALQNVQLLKWCRELGVWPSWNLIWGFPGESPAEYEAMARMVPWLHHLPPPGVACPIQIHRFSPNFERAEELGFRDLRPAAAYRHLYRLPAAAIANLAYYFDYDYREQPAPAGYTAQLAEQVAGWRQSFASSQLIARAQGEGDGRTLVLWDLRAAARRPLTRLTGTARRLYEACDSIRSVPWLRDHAAGEGGALSELEVEELAGPLLEAGLMLRDGERLLSLAVAAA
jgi:hypothetical protein